MATIGQERPFGNGAEIPKKTHIEPAAWQLAIQEEIELLSVCVDDILSSFAYYPSLLAMNDFHRTSFTDIEIEVPESPGIYEIYNLDNVPLKVGISVNLRRRLRQHRQSKQKYLSLRTEGDWSNPTDVRSTRSILTKHLYFSTVDGFNLELEADRQRYLVEHCYILFKVTESREVAREIEKRLEAEGRFRFTGRVQL